MAEKKADKNKKHGKGKTASKKSEKKSSKKSDKRFRIIIFIMLFFVLIFILAYTFSRNKTLTRFDMLYDEALKGKESENGYMYNGFVFVKINDLWYTKLQRGKNLYTVPFHYGPRDVLNIPIDGNVVSFGKYVVQNNSRNLYITFDPTGPELKYIGLANGELSFNIVQTFGFNPVAGCTKNETQGCYGAPIVSCESTDAPVIFLTQAGDAHILQQGNCLTIQGRSYDLIKAVDRLLFTWYGIIKQ